MSKFSVTIEAQGQGKDALRLHRSSYRLEHLPRPGDTFLDSGRGEVTVIKVVHNPYHAGVTLVVK